MPNRICSECGDNFVVVREKSKQKYCGDVCRRVVANRQSAESHRRAGSGLEMVKCRNCGKEFRQKMPNHKFCGDMCRDNRNA